MLHVAPAELADRIAPGQRQGAVEFALKNRDGAFDAHLAARREAVEIGPPETDGVGAERQCLADVIAALTANLRMIRQIAHIYGGRSGTLGSWRLTRAVMAHLVATGAVAVGDDLLGSVGGGHILGKISRRFGEGLVNGALTARVGVAAMEVCRPVPFSEGKRPRVSALIGRALTGLFEKEVSS